MNPRNGVVEPDMQVELGARDLQTPDDLIASARALLEQERFAESEALFRRVIDSPAHASAGLYGIGMTHLASGDPSSAVAFFKRALDHDPENANALYQLGAIAERNGDSEAARKVYERVLAVSPGHVSAHQRLQLLRPLPVSTMTHALSAAVPPAVPSAPAAVAQPPEVAPVLVGGSAIYDFLRQDQNMLSQQTVAALDALEMRVRPRLTAYVGRHLLRSLLFAVLTVGLSALYGFIRVRCMTVAFDRGRLQIQKGIFSRTLTNVDLWRVRSVELDRKFVNRLTGDGTLVLELLSQPGSSRRSRHDQTLELVGLVRGQRLDDVYQQLLNAVFLLRSNPLVKGIIQ